MQKKQEIVKNQLIMYIFCHKILVIKKYAIFSHRR